MYLATALTTWWPPITSKRCIPRRLRRPDASPNYGCTSSSLKAVILSNAKPRDNRATYNIDCWQEKPRVPLMCRRQSPGPEP